VDESSVFDSVDGDYVVRNGDTNGSHHEKRHQNTAPIAEPSKLDNFLATYLDFSGKTFTADQGIKILQWSSWAIAYATQGTHYNDLSPSLRKVSGELSFARYILRFYGFFSSLEGYRSGSWAGGTWDNPQIAKIAKYLMAGSMMCYYPLENVAYAGWKMPGLVKVDANRISAISCGFWTAYIIGDFWASCLKWKELRGRLGDLGGILRGKKRNDEKNAAVDLQDEQAALLKKIRHIKLQVLRCLLFVLPAINWSLPNWTTNPLLKEVQCNGFMLVEAYTSVYQSLRSMCG